MAENIIETRILLRYGTYSQWMNSNVILRQGEAAVCAFPNNRVIDQLSNTTPEHTPPAIGIKIGDGYHRFHELPWVQGIAADVYNWAKTSTKPTYTASEIQGLAAYLEENFNLSGDITIAPRIYQLVEGTGDNENKYYLRYKENNEEGEWVVDTNHEIDLSTYAHIARWIGELLNNYPTIGTFTANQTGLLIGRLNYTDAAQTNKFVTAVSESAGIISVERAQPNFSNLSGYASAAQGGTGRTTLTENSVLVGNGTGAVQLIPIAESIANNNHLVPNNLIKAYVDKAVEGLTGAMHFIGEATVVVNPNSRVDPRISGYDFSKVQLGDVILYDAKEYVWAGSTWRLLGDEGSYAVKGSITNIDIAADAEIDQSKIANLSQTFNTKVDKVEGKTLTSNDFTDELKQKLDGIQTGAQVNAIEHIFVNDEEVTINQLTKTVNLQIQEFTDAAQTKLAGIEVGAQANIIERIVYDGETLVPDENKIVSITSNPHTDHINKIEQIFINGTEWVPNQQKQVKITIDQAALNLNVLEGAIIPNGHGGIQDVTQVAKKLELERIAATGDVADLRQTADTYIVLDCGTSTTVI